jgi:hypothetical protein
MTVIGLGLGILLLMFTFTCTIVPCCRLTPLISDMEEGASEDWGLCTRSYGKLAHFYIFVLIDLGTGDRIAEIRKTS